MIGTTVTLKDQKAYRWIEYPDMTCKLDTEATTLDGEYFVEDVVTDNYGTVIWVWDASRDPDSEIVPMFGIMDRDWPEPDTPEPHPEPSEPEWEYHEAYGVPCNDEDPDRYPDDI